MKYFLLLLVWLPLQFFSQSRQIQMKDETGKVVMLQEGKRVKIVTEDQERYFGKINIINDEQVVMRKDTIALASIVKIQRRSAFKSALSAVIIVSSSVAFPLSIAYVFTDVAMAGTFFAVGSVGLPTGILLPVLGKTYTKKDWTFEIVSP